MSRYLLEVGVEAIPAGYMPQALKTLETRAREGLVELRLAADEVRTQGTAHRLALELTGLADRQEDLVREVQGPREDIAFTDGKPTKAAEGFARKNGVDPAQLEVVETEKGRFVQARVEVAGRPAAEVLPDFLVALVTGLPWPKTMVWNETRFRFPRPVRWVVSMLDDRVLPLSLAGLEAGRLTRGHRLAAPEFHEVKDAGALAKVLNAADVTLDPEDRRERIAAGLAAEAKRLGGRLVVDEGLLDEVIFLTEQPTVLSGGFDTRFLDLPREVTVTAMRSHQRYFAVEDDSGALLPHFLVVCDGRWDDPAQVVAGNERVLRARLADARFYWDVDLKQGLDQLAEGLRSVVWLESVGTLYEKADRVTALVDRLGRSWYAEDWSRRRDDALRAARLAKADLASEMIKDGKEFTGLQGVIGARYAEAQEERPAVSRALSEQYLPRGAADPLPQSPEGTVLAMADRLDTIAGCWAAGFVPSSSQDPYALRRAANGIVRNCLEKGFQTSLGDLVGAAVEQLPEAVRREGLRDEILDFMRDRTAFFLREFGITYDVVDAVLAADADDPLDALTRARALQAIRGEEDLERLVVGFKRAANILKGIDTAGLPAPERVDWSAVHETEGRLHEAVVRAGRGLDEARERKDYSGMLGHLLELRGPIDAFFDDVLVMSEDAVERERRLALLAEARELFGDFFDPARIVIEGEGA